MYFPFIIIIKRQVTFSETLLKYLLFDLNTNAHIHESVGTFTRGERETESVL